MNAYIIVKNIKHEQAEKTLEMKNACRNGTAHSKLGMLTLFSKLNGLYVPYNTVSIIFLPETLYGLIDDWEK